MPTIISLIAYNSQKFRQSPQISHWLVVSPAPSARAVPSRMDTYAARLCHN